MKLDTNQVDSKLAQQYDNDSHQEFFDYYLDASLQKETEQRFSSIQDAVLRLIAKVNANAGVLDVADIGCGAGTFSYMWFQAGHRAHGIDVNEPLVELARKRATEKGVDIEFLVGSATELPWKNESMDVCVIPELLEHVADWQSCLDEFCRILKPNGVLCLTTTNTLCPKQDEFNLPFYSWYPGPLKRYFERVAVTSKPEIVNYAKYPAVNWFSFYKLRSELAKRNLASLDRFDMIDLSTKSQLAQLVVKSIRASKIIRLIAHIITPGTIIFAVKNA